MPGTALRGLELNLASLAAVRNFAENFTNLYSRLDLLVNNAAVAAISYQRTEVGFEMHIGVNHLGHFALSGLLMPQLLAAEEPRLVTVASGRVNSFKLNFDDINSTTHYRRYQAYI